VLNTLRRFDDRRLRYLAVGGWNAGFGYFVSLGLYHWLAPYLHIVLIGAIANVICISMSFFTYKTLVFRTQGNWFQEYKRCYVVYGGNAVLGIAALWLLVNGLHVPFWISQGVVIVAGVVISYVGHTLFTFKRKPS